MAAYSSSKANPLVSIIDRRLDQSHFREQHWEGSFWEYLDIVIENPQVARNAFQRVYDMILTYGTETFTQFKQEVTKYKFFSDPVDRGADAIFGLERPLMQLVDFFRSAAAGYGTEKRILLLHGPVGSSKSTIARLLKKGLEAYSRTDEGKLYTYAWRLPHRMNNDEGEHFADCPMHEDPLLLIPREARAEVLEQINDKLPNERKIRLYGDVCSDPRAFNFDGELNIANRGIVEFIEVLKLDVAFLYDLLGASQEHLIKPKKFAQTYIDEVILGHTNEPEYKKLQGNEMMEAFRDRTIKIDVPYNTKLDDEIKIYNKDFGAEKVRGIHIAPHTIEVAAMWAVLTRLGEPKKAGITKLQKLKLYNGKSIPGFTEDSIKELREENPREGMQGISPRYIQDKISNALVSQQAQIDKAINPFMVMNELEGGLTHHSLITDEELKKEYRELLAVVREEYEDIIKGEVQRAISADEDAIKRLAANYIENVRAYTQHERVRNRFTGREEEPDERLMRSIEEKIDIPDSRKDDFRQEIMNYIGALALDGKKFEYNTNARLLKALELKLFEDQRDTIKLKNLVSSVVDDETQQKIDVVKQRLIKYFGYNETSATDVLNYVASIFARGDSKQDE